MKFLKQKPKIKKVHGTITPVSWDHEGKPNQFSLYTPQEEDIPLLANHKARKLKTLIGKFVEIQGIEFKDNWGEKVIQVRKIRRISSTTPRDPSLIHGQETSTGDYSIQLAYV